MIYFEMTMLELDSFVRLTRREEKKKTDVHVV